MRQPAWRPYEAIETPAVRSVPVDASPDRRIQLARSVRHAAALASEITVLVALLFLFFIRVPQVTGESMQPQLWNGDHVLIDTLAYDARIGPWRVAHVRDLRRGDVIAFVHDAGGQDEIYLKRVIGLPNDTVSFRDGGVLINSLPLREPYAIRQDGATLDPRTVPAGQVYVLGDNRAESDDSRTFGTVPIGSIIGRAAMIVWPPGRARRIR